MRPKVAHGFSAPTCDPRFTHADTNVVNTVATLSEWLKVNYLVYKLSGPTRHKRKELLLTVVVVPTDSYVRNQEPGLSVALEGDERARVRRQLLVVGVPRQLPFLRTDARPLPHGLLRQGGWQRQKACTLHVPTRSPAPDPIRLE